MSTSRRDICLTEYRFSGWNDSVRLWGVAGAVIAKLDVEWRIQEDFFEGQGSYRRIISVHNQIVDFGSAQPAQNRRALTKPADLVILQASGKYVSAYHQYNRFKSIR